MYFCYTAAQLDYLRSRDRILGVAIDRIGPVRREVNPDLFSALVNSIVGQQISTKAQTTIWRRICDEMGCVTPAQVLARGPEGMQRFGISMRKAQYICAAAERVRSGEFDIGTLAGLPDDEVCRVLSAMPGIGVWTAEMLMTFSMQRPDIVSFGDLAIQRGIRMLYRHRKVTPELFRRYRRRWSPCGTVASLYLWAVAGGAIEGLRDPAARRKNF
ncbi:DNA-3-methyladenine glycosylase 2 family protein [Clostridiales bacterium BX7]|uniref:DNA-3-methyladenine glycosylase II n=2 Tax=Feifania hominis TaxID=2763660 RepID=A0A926DDK0_9FIRM|nr:DNA-3-methyladenine glycosylase 2 family protein [Feifania hominis]